MRITFAPDNDGAAVAYVARQGIVGLTVTIYTRDAGQIFATGVVVSVNGDYGIFIRGFGWLAIDAISEIHVL